MALDSALACRRILVADDDPFYRELAASVLADAGYEATLVEDGNAALAELTYSAYDLAILDLTMPGLDGFEVIRAVRGNEATSHLPILVMTGQDDTDSVAHAFELGATSFLSKPLNLPLFVHQVRFVLRSSQTEVELRDAIRTAEFLSDLKTRFMQVLVNEFQSPLRTAYGFTELLRAEADGPLGSPTYKEYVSDLSGAVQQLNALQLKLLNFGRILASELYLQEEELALDQLVTAAVEAARERAHKRGIRLTARTTIPDGATLLCDRALVTQAMKNMMETAITIAPRESAIEVSAAIDPKGDFVFTVEDDAPALPERIVREVLNLKSQPAQALPVPTFARSTGLTISRIIAEAHQGRLALSSRSGEGTAASLIVTADRVQAPEAAESWSEPEQLSA